MRPPSSNTESDDQSVPPIATLQPVMKSDPVIVRSTLSKELISAGTISETCGGGGGTIVKPGLSVSPQTASCVSGLTTRTT